MLVIVSDLHLTDGHPETALPKDSFKLFGERLRDLAYAASVRRAGSDPNAPEGRYEPVDHIHLLMAGDILDVIRSPLWLKDSVRPWDNPQLPAFIKKVREITEAILDKNQASVQALNQVNTQGVWFSKFQTGDPGAEPRVKAEVHTHYMVGNHDWFYHLPGAEYNAIRQLIIDALGLANQPGTVFAHDPKESDDVLNICKEHHVYVRHGDIYDSRNYEQHDRNRSSLGDAIVIELLDRFVKEVQDIPQGKLPQACLDGLDEIDNVRPLDLVPAWVDGLLRRTCNPDQADEVRQVWDRVAADFLKIPFVRDHRSSLKWGLRISHGFSFRDLGRIIPWGRGVVTSLSRMSPALNELVAKWGLSDEYYPNALRDPAFHDPNVSYIVFGHTHNHEVVPLRSGDGHGAGKVFYVNSGTWRAVQELTRSRPKREEFLGYRVMSYLAFFKGDERKGRAFEAWSGALESLG